MKKAMLILSLMAFVSLSFAINPQVQEKSPELISIADEDPKKDTKKCDKDSTKKCAEKKSECTKKEETKCSKSDKKSEDGN